VKNSVITILVKKRIKTELFLDGNGGLLEGWELYKRLAIVRRWPRDCCVEGRLLEAENYCIA